MIAVRGTDLHILNLRTRMPFRYGIAAMTALPHLFVRVELAIDGRAQGGIAADGLPPKWFTKDPDSSFRDDLADLLRVVEAACALARQIGGAGSVFDLWRRLYDAQGRWAAAEGFPPLLWGFGVSLVERATIDAYCRATGTTFADAVRANTLGIRLGDLYHDLADSAPADLLPDRPLGAIVVRHTVGLTDPLTETEIAPAERLDDGLPQSLEASIRAYGLTHFKLKLGGERDRDLARLERLAAVLGEASPHYRFSLDGNEQYRTVGAFRDLWRSLAADSALAPFLSRLLFVEQPLGRDVSLSAETRQALAAWGDQPPIIIDESDGALDTLATALECGYAGTSHKNCKGVFKGIANACLIAHRRRTDPGGRYIISGEDLCNIGPVALPQDLAVVATLGIEHAERNGHHYFAGLRAFPDDIQAAVLARHADLYRRHERGFTTVDVRAGRVAVGSVVAAPFGVGFALDPARFTPVDAWRFDALQALEEGPPASP